MLGQMYRLESIKVNNTNNELGKASKAALCPVL
jgi:hypothetical protein